MDLSKLSRILKRYPILIICSILSVGILFVYSSRASYKQEIMQKLEKGNDELKLIRMNKQQAIGLEDDLNQLHKLEEIIESRLISREEKGRNLDYFYKLESDVGLTMKVTQTDKTDISGKSAAYPKLDLYDSVGFNLQLMGSPQQTLEFIYRLRAYDRLVRMDEFSCRSSTNSDLLQTTLNVECLARKEEGTK